MAQAPAYDLLVAGEINPDLILAGNVEPEFGQVEKLVERASLTIGSSSAIFACGAARLGLKTAFVGYCGDDLFGRFMLDEMHQRGVDTRHVIRQPGGQTGFSVILNRGVDRAILSYEGLMSAMRPDDLPDSLLRQARHLHIASYFLQTRLQPGLPEVFWRARALGLTTSLDTNYDPSETWTGFDALLAVTDIFLPNQTEACSLARTADVEQAAGRLAAKVDTVAVKLGAQGALAMHRAAGGAAPEQARAASLPVEVVDTVGAGDSFDAGFIFGHLQGWPLAKTLRLAAICGALSTRQAGGVVGQATLEEALPYL